MPFSAGYYPGVSLEQSLNARISNRSAASYWRRWGVSYARGIAQGVAQRVASAAAGFAAYRAERLGFKRKQLQFEAIQRAKRARIEGDSVAGSDLPPFVEPPAKQQKMTSVQQRSAIVRKAVRIGRKEPYARKMLKLSKTSERSYVFNFRGINTMSSTVGGNVGYFTLQQLNVPGGIWKTTPVHVFSLGGFPQGRVVDGNGVVATSNLYHPPVHWQLCIKQAGDDNVAWLTGTAGQTNVAGVTHPGYNLIQSTLGPVPLAATPVTRFAYLDWVNARLMIYGKKKQDTKLHIRLVQFTRDHFCPEYDLTRGDDPIGEQNKLEFCDVAKGFVKPMINNPIVSRPTTTRIPLFRTLYSRRVTIPPKDDSDSNDDPYIVNLDLFRRMNRLMDFSGPRDDAGETNAQLNQENFVPITEGQYARGLPKDIRSNVYLMITGWDPIDLGDGPGSSDFQNTYDLNMRVKWTVDA